MLTFCACAFVLQAQAASAATAYALTDGNVLIRFDTSAPGTSTTIGAVSGTVGAEPILAMDFRPLTGRLYGVSATRLYTIDTSTAAASLVAPAQFAPALAGAVGMDFDPVSGMIRLVTDSGQNLRVNPLTAAVTSDTNTSVTGITGVAYTNNFASPDRATLFAIDTTTDQLVRIGGIDLPDNGLSQAGGIVTNVGPIGFNSDVLEGFDITANDNTAWAALAGAADANSSLYSINLATGAGTLRGLFTVGKVRALAVLSRAVTVYGLTSSNAIVTFLSAVPGTLLPQPTGAPVALTGLNGGEQILGIETRPATGDLYAVGNTGRLYIVSPATGQTTFVGQVTAPFVGTPTGFDFDPTTDRLRITTDSGQNLSVNPAGGFATAETALDIQSVMGIAYTTLGTLYGVQASSDRLVTFANPSNGVATLLTPLGIDVADSQTGFDVSPSDGAAFLATTAPAATTTKLYSISLPDGAVKEIGTIGGSVTIRGLAVASPGLVRLSSANYSVLESAGSAPITVERVGGSDGPISVKLAATGDTATGPGDFTPGTFNVEFLHGETTKTVNVFVTPDGDDESDERLNLTLSDPRLGAQTTPPSAGFLTILDDDPSGGGAAPTVTITAPTASPTYAATTLFLTLSGTAADTDGTIASVTWSNNRGFTGTASTGPAAASVEWFANGVQLAPGANTITVTATDNVGNVATDTIVVTVDSLAYYLAEGATGTFFDLDLLLANPNSVPVNITATFLKPLGQGTIVQQYTLAPTSRRTINVETIPGLENAEVSTIVTAPATQPIIVERTMRWDQTGYGAHTDKASAGASQKWFFAEGSQGFFFTYLLLANPQNVANEATVRYLREGTTPVQRTYPLQPLERFTVDLGQDAELVNNSFGMEVTFQQPGIAERSMYFGLNPLWVGGHESSGVTLPSRNWFLAEGATGPFFETFVLFANPSNSAATVDVRYLPSFGSPVSRQYNVAAGQRLTINVEGEDATLANAAVATQVTSNVPILVERAQYWPDPAATWYEAHNSFGVTALGTRWGLAEGRVGGPNQYQTYILLANTNTVGVNASIVFLLENGTTLTKNFTVNAESRLNVQVGVDVPEITEGSFGAVVTSAQPIAVERAMYSNANGQTWQAGTNATATSLPVVVP